jgi:hypothetical protein
MNRNLVAYVSSYLGPISVRGSSRLVQKANNILSIMCTATLRDYSVGGMKVGEIKRIYFPKDFQEESSCFVAHCCDVQAALARASFRVDVSEEDMRALSAELSAPFELLLTKICQLYIFSGENLDQLWEEVRQDAVLDEIMRGFGIEELCSSQEECALILPFSFKSTSSKRAVSELIDSLVVSLIRNDNGKENGVQRTH